MASNLRPWWPVGSVGQEGLTAAKVLGFQPSGLLWGDPNCCTILPLLSALGEAEAGPRELLWGTLHHGLPSESDGKDRLAGGSAAPWNLAPSASGVKDWSEGRVVPNEGV